MTFVRKAAEQWHRDVPGTRWFKADLHIHTIDDHAGGKAKFPPGMSGSPGDKETISCYARRFLQATVRQGVRVLGVTPHSPRVGEGPETSAVWRIVEEWNSGVDEDGTPFRNKIYAVFPGFEPNLQQGSRGLHLLFLFDPEIGRDRYLKAFDLVMGGVSPWDGRELKIAAKDAKGAFEAVRALHQRESGSSDETWNYMVLAPHIDSSKGLLSAQKAQVLTHFPHSEVAGLELGDRKLPEDTENKRQWLRNGMRENRQAFFHGSDAYTLDDIGKRYTWVKLAKPRIEGLRQAFIASDSRIRIAYMRNADGRLHEIPNPPDVTIGDRSWLKSVTVSGGASFFGTNDGDGSKQRFDLSPDLTCIIGGSMTGKSTFLDGLRVYVEADMPTDDLLYRQVKDRAENRFLAGSPTIELQCPGQDRTATLRSQWPAVFHTQNELQRLAQEPGAIEDILVGLASPDEIRDVRERDRELRELDKELNRTANRLAKLDADIADAEQACERSQRATDELAMFADAGVEDFHRISSEVHRWREFAAKSKELTTSLAQTRKSAESLDLPEADDFPMFLDVTRDEQDMLRKHWGDFHDLLRSAAEEIGSLITVARSMVKTLDAHEQGVREDLNRNLADHGLDGTRINELQSLNSHAALLPSYQANLEQKQNEQKELEDRFGASLSKRQMLIDSQRGAFDRIMEKISAAHDGNVVARRIEDGDQRPLEEFLLKWKIRGITRWWNETEAQRRPQPTILLDKADAGQLADVGMRRAVQSTFLEWLTTERRRHLASVRCPDQYVIEWRMDDGKYRRLDDLSGGQRVSVLLSLLLETNDNRPLVIDQPEDELDNRFLFETVLPTLKRLKGRRQVIIATHNANIVVNGDADQVIQLDATANRGRVAQAGAIEQPAVRDAIVKTVDGGGEAFRLRRLKYGY